MIYYICENCDNHSHSASPAPPSTATSSPRANRWFFGACYRYPKQSRDAAATEPQLTRYGYNGRGLGKASYVESPPLYRGTSVQVCGLWPFTAGSGVPTIGTPIGRHLENGSTVSFDPISWFQRARLLSTPIVYCLGRPGLGKSTFARRQVIGAAAQGTIPLILGDLKPDYVDTVRMLGGQVIRLGRGLGSLNPLDVGALGSIIPRLSPRTATEVRQEVHGRRLNTVANLIELVRKEPLADYESTILSTALEKLDAAHEGGPAPVLGDLIAAIEHPDDKLMAIALTDTREEYRTTTKPLLRSLISLVKGPLGDTFARPTSTAIDTDATAVCVDLSGINVADESLTAAILMSTWAEGFSALEASNVLADEGLAPQKHFLVVMDELWRVLRTGQVSRYDELTRINRQWSAGVIFLHHSMSDADTIDRPADRAKARGFIERAGAHVMFGLPGREADQVHEVAGLSRAERDKLVSWSEPASFDIHAGVEAAPPGQGNCLLKVGDHPGIPTHITLTSREIQADVHNTNRRWNHH